MLKEALGGPADLVMTDMAAPTTGHRETDHIRTIALVEIALEVAEDSLKPGGAFVAKVFQGGATGELAGADEEKLPRRQTCQAAGQPRGFGGALSGGAPVSKSRKPPPVKAEAFAIAKRRSLRRRRAG